MSALVLRVDTLESELHAQNLRMVAMLTLLERAVGVLEKGSFDSAIEKEKAAEIRMEFDKLLASVDQVEPTSESSIF